MEELNGFRPIEMDGWARKAYFEHFEQCTPCMFAITSELDISRALASGRRLYPVMIHSIASVVNAHEEFRISRRSDGTLGMYERLVPSYTVFRDDTKTFTNVWTEPDCSLDSFCDRYEHDVAAYGRSTLPEGKPGCPANSFPISMIPWISFTGFELQLRNGYGYYFPIFTMGRYRRTERGTTIPISIQVNHAVSDAYHVSALLDELQCILDGIR